MLLNKTGSVVETFGMWKELLLVLLMEELVVGAKPSETPLRFDFTTAYFPSLPKVQRCNFKACFGPLLHVAFCQFSFIIRQKPQKSL